MLLLVGAFAACSNDDNTGGGSPSVAAPSGVIVQQLADTQVRVLWNDNSDNETGFSVWIRSAADANDRKEAGSVAADVTECVIEEGLEAGGSYYFGVQAKAASSTGDSRIIYTRDPYKLQSMADMPSVTISDDVISTSACIAVSYTVSKGNRSESDLLYGLCWTDGNASPTYVDTKQLGPKLPATNGAMFQVIPNTLLEYGKTYKIRAFVRTSLATYYSKEITASLGTAPEAIKLNWTKLSKSTLPAEIELYETTDKLNGRNFHAWYAVADLSKGNVGVRVTNPSKASNIKTQAASFGSDCYVMTNAGFFYSGHIGMIVVDGKPAGQFTTVRGSLKSDDAEYDVVYNVTRGMFGVNASGQPAVYWAATNPSSATHHYFDRPLPSVAGRDKYGPVTGDFPTTEIAWNPQNAVQAGPVLLKDGKCPFDFTLSAKGTTDNYYLSNYEIMPYDIFGTTSLADRTAVGYLADGRVVLFVCDGRITASQGAKLTELAQVMKGIGCVDAVNLDGGGSTGMVIGGEYINYTSGTNDGTRPVYSAIGFFRK